MGQSEGWGLWQPAVPLDHYCPSPWSRLCLLARRYIRAPGAGTNNGLPINPSGYIPNSVILQKMQGFIDEEGPPLVAWSPKEVGYNSADDRIIDEEV